MCFCLCVRVPYDALWCLLWCLMNCQFSSCFSILASYHHIRKNWITYDKIRHKWHNQTNSKMLKVNCFNRSRPDLNLRPRKKLNARPIVYQTPGSGRRRAASLARSTSLMGVVREIVVPQLGVASSHWRHVVLSTICRFMQVHFGFIYSYLANLKPNILQFFFPKTRFFSIFSENMGFVLKNLVFE